MRYLLSFTVLCVSSLLFGHAASASGEWGKTKYSEVRVLTSPFLSETTGHKYMVGLHIKMQKKWKTYWRQPGDAGIPPYFDWKGSENIKSVKVLWPAPIRIVDPYVTTIGYETEVVFPVVFEAKDASKPINAKLTFAYGVCLDVCIPEERKVSFSVPSASSSRVSDHKLLEAYYKRVPRVVGQSLEKSYLVRKSPVIRGIKTDLSSDKPKVSFTVIFPPKSKKNDIFVEASGGYFIAEPKKSRTYEWKRENGQGTELLGVVVEYQIDLTKGDKPSGLKGKTLTATMVSDQANTQTSWVVE